MHISRLQRYFHNIITTITAMIIIPWYRLLLLRKPSFIKAAAKLSYQYSFNNHFCEKTLNAQTSKLFLSYGTFLKTVKLFSLMSILVLPVARSYPLITEGGTCQCRIWLCNVDVFLSVDTGSSQKQCITKLFTKTWSFGILFVGPWNL